MCAGWYKRGAQNIAVHPSQRWKPLITNYELNCVLGIITGIKIEKPGATFLLSFKKINKEHGTVTGVIESREECYENCAVEQVSLNF